MNTDAINFNIYLHAFTLKCEKEKKVSSSALKDFIKQIKSINNTSPSFFTRESLDFRHKKLMIVNSILDNQKSRKLSSKKYYLKLISSFGSEITDNFRSFN